MGPLQNIQSFAITNDPWVSTAPFEHYLLTDAFDSFEDRLSRAKYFSHLNERPDEVVRAVFSTFKSASTAWVVFAYEDDALQYGVVRNADGSVKALVEQELRASESESPYHWTPFVTVFPKERTLRMRHVH